MIDACKKEGIPEPIFQERSGGLAVIFRFKTYIGQEIAKRAIEALNLRQKMIAEFLRETKSATTVDVLNYLVSKNITAPTHRTILRDLHHLNKIGIVDLQGQTRGGIWVLREDVL